MNSEYLWTNRNPHLTTYLACIGSQRPCYSLQHPRSWWWNPLSSQQVLILILWIFKLDLQRISYLLLILGNISPQRALLYYSPFITTLTVALLVKFEIDNSHAVVLESKLWFLIFNFFIICVPKMPINQHKNMALFKWTSNIQIELIYSNCPNNIPPINNYLILKITKHEHFHPTIRLRKGLLQGRNQLKRQYP